MGPINVLELIHQLHSGGALANLGPPSQTLTLHVKWDPHLFDHTWRLCLPAMCKICKGMKGGQTSGAPLSPSISTTHVQRGHVKTINSLHSGSDPGNGFLVHVSTSSSCKRIGISFQTSNDSNRLGNVPQNVSTN